jgi:Domain of unknown function (DUF1905)/Bacteriocin-protection, YdeI or OmpD-Associated
MTQRFEATLREPAHGEGWAFVVLPRAVSETLPRRGRVSVEGRLNDAPYQALLEPDGQLSHWLRVDAALMAAAGVGFGDRVVLDLAPMAEEPEPACPSDFERALADSPKALAGWRATTVLARVDWVHWIESAKQAKTRASRVASGVDQLASGKLRVCCFDVSGYYSKAFKAPQEA